MLHKRFLILVPFLCLTFLGSGTKEDRAPSHIKTYFQCIGPFEKGCEDYLLSGKVDVLIPAFLITEKMTVKTMDGLLIKTEKKAAHNLIKNESYYLTFTLPFHSSLTDNGLKVTIEFLRDDNSVLESFSFKIKSIKETTINPKDYINQSFIIEDIVVDPDDYYHVNSEKIKFDQTLDYFNVDNYYRLSLSDTFITYQCGKDFPGCTAHLHFTDYMKIFPYLDSDDEIPTFEIPLRTITENNGVFFAFPPVMYVKPSTLEMSLEARPGFQSTSFFYLPKNKCEALLDQLFVIDVANFGYGKTSFRWEMRYTNNNRLIGDCSHSDYCVIGETTNG